MILRSAIQKTIKNESEQIDFSTSAPWITGDSTNSASAMKLSAVNACVEILSNSMGKLPIYILDDVNKKRLSDHPLNYLLSVRPNEAMTPFVERKLIERNRLLGGNGYEIIVRDSISSRPKELLPVPPTCVTPFFDSSGVLWYMFTNPKTGEQRRINQWDMKHYKAYSEDGINGISVLSRAADVIKTAMDAQDYEKKFYKNSANPGGVIQADGQIDKAAKDVVRAEWEKVHAGVDNAFRVAVLDLGMKYQQIGISNRDAQFVESKEVSIEDISRFFGVPMYKLGVGKQSYSSNEQNGIEYVVGTVHPTVNQYEEEDSYKMLFDSELKRGLWVKRNMMAELRGDMSSRAAWYKTGREIGYFSVNDICDLEDTPHVPGGDTRNASLNYVPLEDFQQLSLQRNSGGGEKKK